MRPSPLKVLKDRIKIQAQQVDEDVRLQREREQAREERQAHRNSLMHSLGLAPVTHATQAPTT